MYQTTIPLVQLNSANQPTYANIALYEIYLFIYCCDQAVVHYKNKLPANFSRCTSPCPLFRLLQNAYITHTYVTHERLTERLKMVAGTKPHVCEP